MLINSALSPTTDFAPWSFLAPYTVLEYDISGIKPRPPDWWFGGSCIPLVRREWHNHVDNYGNYMPGYCGGLYYGDIGNLDSLLSGGLVPDDHPILSCLVDNNLEGLYELAKSYGYRNLDEGYHSRCHLCLDLKAYLDSKENFLELNPPEFYRQLPTNY